VVKKKILIVEDNELNLRLFHDLLELKNLEVLSTKDGNLFFDMAKHFMPDLVLMDIQLQGVSGFDLIKLLKTDEKLKDIPIIAITAFAMKSDEERILEAGCQAYIAKPVSIERFYEVIDQFIVQQNISED
jgi:two-component system cell cycle response regulator DivK